MLTFYTVTKVQFSLKLNVARCTIYIYIHTHIFSMYIYMFVVCFIIYIHTHKHKHIFLMFIYIIYQIIGLWDNDILNSLLGRGGGI